jgi:hypothetical protein
MNRWRGLLRLWLVGTAVWLIGWAIFIRLTCHTLPDGKLMCQAAPGGWVARWGEFAAWSYFELLLLGLSVPAGISSWALSRPGWSEASSPRDGVEHDIKTVPRCDAGPASSAG